MASWSGTPEEWAKEFRTALAERDSERRAAGLTSIYWPPENSIVCAAEHGKARAHRRRHALVTPETLAQRIIFCVALAIVLIFFVFAGFQDLVR